MNQDDERSGIRERQLAALEKQEAELVKLEHAVGQLREAIRQQRACLEQIGEQVAIPAVAANLGDQSTSCQNSVKGQKTNEAGRAPRVSPSLPNFSSTIKDINKSKSLETIVEEELVDAWHRYGLLYDGQDEQDRTAWKKLYEYASELSDHDVYRVRRIARQARLIAAKLAG